MRQEVKLVHVLHESRVELLKLRPRHLFFFKTRASSWLGLWDAWSWISAVDSFHLEQAFILSLLVWEVGWLRSRVITDWVVECFRQFWAWFKSSHELKLFIINGRHLRLLWKRQTRQGGASLAEQILTHLHLLRRPEGGGQVQWGKEQRNLRYHHQLSRSIKQAAFISH